MLSSIHLSGIEATLRTCHQELAVICGEDPVEAKREAKRKKEALNFSAYCDKFIELYRACQ